VTRVYGFAFVVLLAVGGGLLWWRHQRSAPEVVAAPPATVAPAVPPPAAAPPPTAPAIRHPLPAAPAGGLPALDRSDAYFQGALSALLGQKKVRAFLHLDGVASRFVATVNNLTTDDASASLWPVKTTEGSFETEPRDGGRAIGARNADRYVPFVHFVDGIDARRAVGLYLQAYPLLQQAYEDLGFPGMYFNDRVVEVIDNLLATPTPAGPITVKRFAADGGTPGGGLYVYADPALEASSAGQKILLRMGRDNAAPLTAKLREIRTLIVAGPAAER
jgi:Protein of unknown function (DUF3014)